MSAETATLTVRVYRTPAGAPTCATNFKTGDVCQFLRTQRLGTEDVCCFSPDGRKRQEPLNRDDGENGYLLPFHGCPVWPTKAAA